MTGTPTALDPQRQRLAESLAAARLHPRGEPRPVLSHSNDTWLVEDAELGDVVLRVCWRGDPARLLREAAVGAALPAEVGYPQVLGAGAVPGGPLTWALTRRLPGRPLAEAWPRLDRAGRAAATRSVAERLRSLHGFRPDAELARQLRPTPLGPAPTVDEVVGRTMLPWPAGTTVLLQEVAGLLPGPLLEQVSALVDAGAGLAPGLDEQATSLVHGDLHLNNIWSDAGQVTGLLDLEWVRPAEPWVDLVRIVDQAEEDALTGDRGHAELLTGLRRSYPELFAVDRLDERLRFLLIAYQLRQLAIWPDPEPGRPTAPDHPSRRLAALVAAQAP